MLINNFSQGINTRLAPHLLSAASAVVYSNVDNTDGTLAPIKMPTNLYVDSNKYFYYFEDKWISSSAERSYVLLQNVLYWTQNGTKPNKMSGGVRTQIGISRPTIRPKVEQWNTTGQGDLNGTYTYYITYYDDVHDIESKPLICTPATVIINNSTTRVSGIPKSSDFQVNKIRLYRIGGTLTSRTLVATINQNTSYIDRLSDIDIDGYIMESDTYNVPPISLMYLTEHNSSLVGAKGDKVYFALLTKPNAWPTMNYIVMPNAVTGLSSTPSGLLVFTAKATYVITGTEFSVYSKYPFDGSQGCINHNTIANLGGSVLWVSADGICTVEGGRVVVVSRPVLDSIGVSINAVVHNDIYYLQLEDKIIAIDSRFGLVFVEFGYKFNYLGMFNDKLYGVRKGSIHTLFSSNLVEDINWLSAEFSEGAMTHKKIYYGVYFNSVGRLTVEILIDGRSAQFQPLNITGITEILIPQELQNGYSIQFRIRGKGVLKEIEYKVQGRTNAR